MLFITCPCCGAAAEETEFHCGGEAHIERAARDEDSDQDFGAHLFDRKNPKGVHLERWRHQFGCGKWFHMARDTRTLEIYGTYAITDRAPPAEVSARIVERLAETGLPERSIN